MGGPAAKRGGVYVNKPPGRGCMLKSPKPLGQTEHGGRGAMLMMPWWHCHWRRSACACNASIKGPWAKISWRRKCVSKHKCGRRVAEGYSEAGAGLSRKAAGHQGSQLGEICEHPQTPHGSHRGITGSRQSRKAGSAPSCEQGRIRCTSGGNVSAPGRHPAAEIGKQLASLTQWRADNRGCVCASSWKSRGGFVERQGGRTAGPKEGN